MTAEQRKAIADAVQALEKAEQVYLANDIHPLSIAQCRAAQAALSAILAEPDSDDAALRLSELMRGLEIPPGPLSAHALYCIGAAIARQAKSAPGAMT